MNRMHGVLKAVAFSGLMVGIAYAAEEKSNLEVFEDGFAAVKKILAEREDFKRRVGVLEKAKSDLEALLAINTKDETVLQALVGLKAELEDLFVAEGGAKEDNIRAVIKKISMLKKELKELFPTQCKESKSDVLGMIQSLSTLNTDLETFLPKQEMVCKNDEAASAETPVLGVADRFSSFKTKLNGLFPGEDKDILTKINGRIADYEQALSKKDVDIETLRKELAGLKKEIKDVTGYLRELAGHAIKNRG